MDEATRGIRVQLGHRKSRIAFAGGLPGDAFSFPRRELNEIAPLILGLCSLKRLANTAPSNTSLADRQTCREAVPPTRIVPLIEKSVEDHEVGVQGKAQDALDDIQMFVTKT